jgi:hypothetical protein
MSWTAAINGDGEIPMDGKWSAGALSVIQTP